VIDRSDPRFAIVDAVAFKSKNLYNAALYEMRQAFIFQGKRLFYKQMDELMQQHEAYRALPAKVSQQVLKQLDTAWESYFKACEVYREDPSKFSLHSFLSASRPNKIPPLSIRCVSSLAMVIMLWKSFTAKNPSRHK
jgi:hypothetical protein